MQRILSSKNLRNHSSRITTTGCSVHALWQTPLSSGVSIPWSGWCISRRKRLDTGSSVRIIQCMPEYKRRSFLSEEELQRIIHIEPRYKRQRAMRDMFLFMCFTGLSYVDLKAITYDNIHTDSDGGTWLMGNRIKTGVAYVVKLLPIAIELIEKYRGTDEKKDSPNVSFR